MRLGNISQDIIIKRDGILIYYDLDYWKKYIYYRAKSHYYDFRFKLNFLKQVERK
jgi:hypothetical protein